MGNWSQIELLSCGQKDYGRQGEGFSTEYVYKSIEINIYFHSTFIVLKEFRNMNSLKYFLNAFNFCDQTRLRPPAHLTDFNFKKLHFSNRNILCRLYALAMNKKGANCITKPVPAK